MALLDQLFIDHNHGSTQFLPAVCKKRPKICQSLQVVSAPENVKELRGTFTGGRCKRKVNHDLLSACMRRPNVTFTALFGSARNLHPQIVPGQPMDRYALRSEL